MPTAFFDGAGRFGDADTTLLLTLNYEAGLERPAQRWSSGSQVSSCRASVLGHFSNTMLADADSIRKLGDRTAALILSAAHTPF
jgi:hypothetical protein